jgi:hypothetical protein
MSPSNSPSTKKIIKKDSSINSNEDKTAAPSIIPIISSSQLNLKYDEFSEEKKILISNISTSMIEKQIDLHPLSHGMHVDLLNQVCQEVAYQLRPLLVPCLLTNISESKDIIQKLLQDEFKKSNVYMELLALISFSLTYVYERCVLAGNINENEEPTTTTTSQYQALSPEIKEQILSSNQELEENTSEEDNNYEESYLHSSSSLQQQQNVNSLRNYNNFDEESFLPSEKVLISKQSTKSLRSQNFAPTNSFNYQNESYDIFEEKTLRPKTVSSSKTPRYMQSPKRQSIVNN